MTILAERRPPIVEYRTYILRESTSQERDGVLRLLAAQKGMTYEALLGYITLFFEEYPYNIFFHDDVNVCLSSAVCCSEPLVGCCG